MLSNAYFLAKFRFDTAENEPAKSLQNFRKCIFEKCIFRMKVYHMAWAFAGHPARLDLMNALLKPRDVGGCGWERKTYLCFRFDFASDQSIKISSTYQHIGCIDADFYDQGAKFQHFQDFAGNRRIPIKFRKNSVNI